MKRKSLEVLRCIAAGLIIVAIGLLAMKTITEAEEELKQVDNFIETHSTTVLDKPKEIETVSLSYKEWKKENDNDNDNSDLYIDSTPVNTFCVDEQVEFIEPETEFVEDEAPAPEPDIYSMDVWTLGAHLYGISELDTTRSLILITYEGYGADSPLSYYVACCCWNRCTNGYLGYSDLYTSFGGADESYNTWMDGLWYDDYAIEALRQCYLNPSYVTSCNGMECPEAYIYSEWNGGNMIYVW